ncbi:hypothetical protein EXU57_14015 [Segetibacter sp. 3557_3]|uniref:hypothetical protein n=1 Tax=Segetibacter sp. 3557_3 TaxID=2547429 RepID=UPI001058B4C2|nr:hypothetical protein [Segetibacter sp. 3557_3]TDH25216.1 hypothetical protein EXU57_14015 [Segetibacter sp. 3557_3]
MAGTPNTSSSQVLQKLLNQKENGNVKPEMLHKINNEVERKMEQFDLQKKERIAKAVQDLSMLVINA